MISQKTRAQIGYAYGFQSVRAFLKHIQDNNIRLPAYCLLDQDDQIDLYAKMGIPKGLEEEEKTVLLPLVEAYQRKQNLPIKVHFILPKTRARVAADYGYTCKRTFTRHLNDKAIVLLPKKQLDQAAQIDLYAKMGIPKGLDKEERSIIALLVADYCKEQDLPPPYYKKVNMSNSLPNCPVFYQIYTCVISLYAIFLHHYYLKLQKLLECAFFLQNLVLFSVPSIL